MSSLRGPTIFGKRARRASITSDVSSTESVVWVINDSRASFLTSSLRTSSGELDQVHAPLRVIVLPHSAFDFRVAGMADQNRLFATAAGAGDFHMDFGPPADRWPSNTVRSRLFASLRTACRNTVGGENQDRAVRHFADLFDKNGARACAGYPPHSGCAPLHGEHRSVRHTASARFLQC
ncbi:Uncharacterised protein [Klebsiella variicola]|uniref:Uncharacterized protein n=1 Tax=Klebsiella variicola TaxID=244366 RepID=A0A7H4MD42_KLEVA|nr:Uncharacterised protein [Klebsiella variicola]